MLYPSLCKPLPDKFERNGTRSTTLVQEARGKAEAGPQPRDRAETRAQGGSPPKTARSKSQTPVRTDCPDPDRHVPGRRECLVDGVMERYMANAGFSLRTFVMYMWAEHTCNASPNKLLSPIHTSLVQHPLDLPPQNHHQVPLSTRHLRVIFTPPNNRTRRAQHHLQRIKVRSRLAGVELTRRLRAIPRPPLLPHNEASSNPGTGGCTAAWISSAFGVEGLKLIEPLAQSTTVPPGFNTYEALLQKEGMSNWVLSDPCGSARGSSALWTIRKLSSDICLSAATFAGSPRIVGIIWPLSVVAQEPANSLATRRWAVEKLRSVNHSIGFRQAGLLAENISGKLDVIEGQADI
ncbi:hypothetical protein DL765_010325 [Monosporascus sp. GIB2]|nr:hypothetical protein DL765_010325 [Monosporascus sp. GIB2]